MYLVKTPWWLKTLYGKDLTWTIDTAEKEVFLTFDDGPHPSITAFVLDCLKVYNARATFFCLGNNVEQFPETYRRILDEGHRVGNHTYSHLNGWKTDDKVYFDDIARAKNFIDSNLFRPPYGRMTKFQAQHLQSVFRVVMWDVLSADFDKKVTKEQCLANVMKNAKAGSIVVFHDSEKAFPSLEYVLPKALTFFAENGYAMKTIDAGK